MQPLRHTWGRCTVTHAGEADDDATQTAAQQSISYFLPQRCKRPSPSPKGSLQTAPAPPDSHCKARNCTAQIEPASLLTGRGLMAPEHEINSAVAFCGVCLSHCTEIGATVNVTAVVPTPSGSYHVPSLLGTCPFQTTETCGHISVPAWLQRAY